jgi:hypothetical protein
VACRLGPATQHKVFSFGLLLVFFLCILLTCNLPITLVFFLSCAYILFFPYVLSSCSMNNVCIRSDIVTIISTCVVPNKCNCNAHYV